MTREETNHKKYKKRVHKKYNIKTQYGNIIIDSYPIIKGESLTLMAYFELETKKEKGNFIRKLLRKDWIELHQDGDWEFTCLFNEKDLKRFMKHYGLKRINDKVTN